MTHWYVIRTKPKQEERVRGHLKTTSFEVFVPQITRMLKTVPLFPSYLFVKAELKDPAVHQLIRFTRGVQKILGDQFGPQPVVSEIIETLRRMTQNGSIIEQDLIFKVGDAVLVKKGLLKDLIGIIEKNVSELGRVKILFRWLSGNVQAFVKYTELEKAA